MPNCSVALCLYTIIIAYQPYLSKVIFCHGLLCYRLSLTGFTNSIDYCIFALIYTSPLQWFLTFKVYCKDFVLPLAFLIYALVITPVCLKVIFCIPFFCKMSWWQEIYTQGWKSIPIVKYSTQDPVQSTVSLTRSLLGDFYRKHWSTIVQTGVLCNLVIFTKELFAHIMTWTPLFSLEVQMSNIHTSCTLHLIC